MGYSIDLPKDNAQLEDVVKTMLDSGKAARRIEEVNWWLGYHYLKGARDFSNLNFQEGTLDVSYVDEEGYLTFRYDDIVSKYQSQVGRLNQIDLAPSVDRKGIGLEGLRNSSIGQIVLDAVMPPRRVKKLKMELFPTICRYGTVGLSVWYNSEGAEETMGVDVVPPWELLPIPGNLTERLDSRGIARVRTVPIEWVQSLNVTPGKGARVWQEMEKTSITRGHSVDSSRGSTFRTFADSVTTSGSSSTSEKKDDSNVDMVEFVEIWLDRPDGFLKEYVLLAGEKFLYRKSYDDMKLHIPCNIAYDIDTGGFWGKSFISLLIPMNVELENTISRVFQNIQDLDTYGMLIEPTTLGIPAMIMRGADGTKRVRYEPDYTMPDLKPQNIVPVNSGLLPEKVIRMGTDLIDKLANQPAELMSGGAPGRVDSQAGLGFLYEVSNMPLSPTALSIGEAVSNSYRCLLGLCKARWGAGKVVEISMLDDTLAGVIIDPRSGSMKLEDNAIPHPDQVNITIASELPKSKEQEKMELQQSLELGILDVTEYRIECRKRGLSTPTGNEEEWQSYRRAMMENLILFGDGKKPGQVIPHELDMHDIHGRIVKAFIARPEFHASSPEVKDKFYEHYKYHGIESGILPDDIPYPEDAAEEEALMQQMQGGGGMPSMPGMEGMEGMEGMPDMGGMEGMPPQ